jgi:RNA polymerase sigma factor for flagellar operon FliA
VSVAAEYLSGRRQSARSQQDTNRLVTEHASLIKRIGYHLLGRLPSHVQIEDLLQAGAVGLLEAAQHYDPSQGASFKTYAGIRIRGAMLDELRRTDWTPRSVHRGVRQMAEAIRTIQHREGREAKDSEIAEAMGLDAVCYQRLLRDASACRVLSVEDANAAAEAAPHEGEGPAEAHQREAFAEALTDAISLLPERERTIMSLYYDDELNLREIGAALGVTESRVCQILGQAHARLRARLPGWIDA